MPLLALGLSACTGGSTDSGGVLSTPTPAPSATPTPTPSPTPAPTPTPTPASVNYNTAEYRRSSASYAGAITAYQAGASGAGITVGIVDSGLADPDGEFTGRISPLSRDFAGNGTITDVGGHGTAVAETLAGARNDEHVMGMAWGATVMALRTDRPGSCTETSGCSHPSGAMAQAIDYAWQNGARIINISLGSDGASGDIIEAVRRATNAGTIIVVSAGNVKEGEAAQLSPNGLATAMANPSVGHGLVIIATSVDADNQISSFSAGAKGYETVTLSAVGRSVRTIDHSATDLLYTGTSFSAPQIAGAAALLAQAFPNLTSAQIVQLLMSTATDAGAVGADAVYGRGILNVAAAFAPQGTLSLAGTGTTVSLGATSQLSTAMGDATGSAMNAIVLDGYRRPYSMRFGGALAASAARRDLAATLDNPTRQISGSAGPLRLALSIGQSRMGVPHVRGLALNGNDEVQARFLSGTIMASLAGRSTVALGLRTSAHGLETMLSGAQGPAFIIARDGAGDLGAEMRTTSSMAMHHRLTRTLSLIGGIETGEVDGYANRAGLAPIDPIAGRTARYQAASLVLTVDRGPLSLASGLRLVTEQGSALGARFAPAFGAQSARTLFASFTARAQPAARLSLAASVQRGWTYAAAGGALAQGGLLKSQSWSAQMSRTGLFAPGDLIGLRIASPLRVMASRFRLALPQSWDWETETATYGYAALNLVPRGTERDMELSYGRGMAGGWLGANLYWRREAGHLETAPDDLGVALRWSTGF